MTRAVCPWYISAAAVRRYMELARVSDFDDASDALIAYAAETWRRYLADPARKPGVTRTGAYRYRGPGPLRLQLVVSMTERAEGDKPQLVDVWPASEIGPARGGRGSLDRRRAKRREERAAVSPSSPAAPPAEPPPPSTGRRPPPCTPDR